MVLGREGPWLLGISGGRGGGVKRGSNGEDAPVVRVPLAHSSASWIATIPPAHVCTRAGE
jgi:hypothetical protein